MAKNDNSLRSETGLFKPYVQAEVTLSTLSNDTISGDIHVRGARILRYMRLAGMGNPKSFNQGDADEMLGLIQGIAAIRAHWPDAFDKGKTAAGLKAYKPNADTAGRYQVELVLEALELLIDALDPFLDTGDSRTAPDWAVTLYKGFVLAQEELVQKP